MIRQVIAIALLAGSVVAQTTDAPTSSDKTIQRATDFLLEDQNDDGSWGSWDKPAHEFWSNPETHKSWIAATTALGCMAFQDATQTEQIQAAYDRGVDYLIANAVVKRPSDWDTDNTWAYIYGLQGVARAIQNPRYSNDTARLAKLRDVGNRLIAALQKYQTPSGGWGYYDFEVKAPTPAWATSFMTAVAVLALHDARAADLDVPPDMLRIAAKAVAHCRMRNGAYTYSVNAITAPRHSEWIDTIKGSLSRIQVCNLALLKSGYPVTQDDLRTGLDHFFKHHRFLDVARKKPIPHEAYYANSGYFYFFGHYYAAQVINELPEADRRKYTPLLAGEIIKTQENDGSMWDFYFNTYHKPYGTAYGMMSLQMAR